MSIYDLKAYHYFEKKDGPMASLSKLAFEEAVKLDFKNYDNVKAKETHMKKRFLYEKLMYNSFKSKGGNPKQSFPYYFSIGKDDRITYLYKNPAYIAMDITNFEPEVISFTYCDSFYTYERRDNHPTRRKIYTLGEIDSIIEQYGMPYTDDYWPWPYVLEMQVWDDVDMKNYIRDNGIVEENIEPNIELKKSIDSHLLKYKKYFDLLKPDLFFDPEGIHGVSHTKRVMVLALFLLEKLKIKSNNDIIIVLIAALYHDIGRVNNKTDDTHGVLSWRKLNEITNYKVGEIADEEIQYVKFIIENHCKYVDVNNIIGLYEIRDVERMKILYNVLRDADILDRIRLGDIDPSYLYFDDSKKLLLVSEFLYLGLEENFL